MGLDTSHGAWNGPYSAFMTWRTKIAEVAGFPPLELMEGYYSEEGMGNPFTLLDYRYPKGDELPMYQLRIIRQRLPIKWNLFEGHPLVTLLIHSDCDGEIEWQDCKPIADELTKLLNKFPEEPAGGRIRNWKQQTQTFIDGLLKAYEAKENLDFH